MSELIKFRKKAFWHLTSINNFHSILKEGLLLNEQGKIFLFDEKKYAGYIAENQLGLFSFALFKVKKLNEARLLPDNVGEFTAKAQWIYDQEIPSSDLVFEGCFDIKKSKETK